MSNRAPMFKKERKKRIRPADDATSYIQSATDKPGLIERFIDRTKGSVGSVRYPTHRSRCFCLGVQGRTPVIGRMPLKTLLRDTDVDASKEDGSLGRLVNDNHMSPNCTMKKIIVNGRPHLCIFAARKIEVGTEIDYNYGDSKWPWRNKGADELAPAVAVEAFTTSVTSYDSSNRDDVTDELAPAVAVETFITNVTSNENSNTDQGADELAPAVAVEAFTTSVTSYDSSNRDDVTDELAPAVAVETFITNVTSNENSNTDQGADELAPAVAVEAFTTSVTSYDSSNRDDVTDELAPAVAVETFITNVTSNENSNTDQVVTGRRLFLVDYSDTDQSDEDCLKYQPLTPHYDEHGCILKEENILLVGVPDFPDLVHHSNESIVEETEDEDSKKEHSNTVQSDNEDVPKLRRTKSILMDRVTDFSVGLYDSSDDSSEGPSTSNADMVSQRQRRCCRPIQMSLVGLDDSSADSGEEFIPNFKEESTDSDCSLELSLENTSQSRRKMSSQGRTKSSKQSRRKMSSQGRTESSKQSRRKMSSQGRTKSSKQSSSEFSSQGRTKSSKQSRRKMSSQGRTKSSKQSSSEFSSQGRTKSSKQSRRKMSSQGRTKSSKQSSSEFSSQGRTKSSQQSSSEFSSQGRTKSSQQSSSEFSSQGRTKSSKQSSSEFSSQGRTKSSQQSSSEFSSQGRTKSSQQSSSEFSSQGRTKSSKQSSSEFSSQGRTKSSKQSSSEFSSQGRTKSSQQSSSEFSSQGRTKSSQQSSSEFSSQGRTKSSKQSRSEFSSQGRTKSSKQSRSEFSSQSRTTSSSQSQFESSQNRSFETGQDFTQGFPQSSGDVNEEEMVQMYTDQKLSVSEPLVNKASVYVSAVLKKDDGSRRYNKKHHCLYCGQIVQKMSRHLFRKHGDEVDVAKALSFPKNSKQRHLQLEYIRKKGNYEHNTEVLESKKGKLIPCKQPNKKTDGQQFMHCIHCYGLFTRRVMWRHFQVCKFKPEGKTSKPGKTRVQAMCAFAEPAPVGLSDAYWKFINYMNQDKIAIAVKQDPCILEYGYRLFKKNERVVTQHQYIRQKLRELGRLVLAAKNVTPVNTIKELIKPEKYTHVVTAARCLAGYNEETGKYQRPSLARKVGHTLHSLAMYVKSEGLKMKDKETAQNAEEFTQLYQESWKYDIASEALTQLDQSKWNAPQLLPFTQDVQSLHSHLSEKQEQHLNALKGEVSPSNWKDLAKVTLAQVILFNRRREGEVSRMSLSAYLSKDASETHEDVNLALTALEQKLCKHFVRLTIVGKRGRKVPVLLTPLMRESLDTLIQKREECGVLNENGFLFALPHSVHYLRGSDCIRQFVHECDGIKNPKALTSTKLRKHIATLSTVLNLKTTELDQLADFLGHNIDVHRKHYRLPEGTLQLAKISKVLLAMEQGRLGEYKGKSLDEIHIDLNETVDMEGCSQEDMEGCSQEDMEDCSQEDMEDASMPVEQGSEDEVSVASSRGKQRKSAKKRGTVDIEGCSQENMEDASMPVEQGSEDEVSVASLEECTSTVHVQRKSAGKRGKEATVKRSWTPEECAAVGRHLRKFIVIHQVPGKIDCESCIAAEPEALGNRDWKSVKYYVKNRISSLRRKMQ